MLQDRQGVPCSGVCYKLLACVRMVGICCLHVLSSHSLLGVAPITYWCCCCVLHSRCWAGPLKASISRLAGEISCLFVCVVLSAMKVAAAAGRCIGERGLFPALVVPRWRSTCTFDVMFVAAYSGPALQHKASTQSCQVFRCALMPACAPASVVHELRAANT